MPPVNHRQFFKANPNQMAFPGMEEHAHPGAKALAEGYSFHFNAVPDPTTKTRNAHLLELSLQKPGEPPASTLNWVDLKQPDFELGPGEISMVETRPGEEGKGLASALYGVGRTMARIKPRHSTKRTQSGDRWARSVSQKYGGRVPKKNTL